MEATAKNRIDERQAKQPMPRELTVRLLREFEAAWNEGRVCWSEIHVCSPEGSFKASVKEIIIDTERNTLFLRGQDGARCPRSAFSLDFITDLHWQDDLFALSRSENLEPSTT